MPFPTSPSSPGRQTRLTGRQLPKDRPSHSRTGSWTCPLYSADIHNEASASLNSKWAVWSSAKTKSG